MALIGRDSVLVHRREIVAVLSTGDELVSPPTPPSLDHVYDSNSVALSAAVVEAGGVARPLGIAGDNPDDVLDQRVMR